MCAALHWRGLRRPGRDREMALGLIRRTPIQLVRPPERAQLSVRCRGAGREADEELVCGGPLTSQDEVEPIVREQASSKAPLPRRLRVPDRLDHVAVLSKPLGGGAMHRRQFVRCGPLQLELQQIHEQAVIAKPRSARINRDHESPRVLQLLQDPLPVRASGQPVCQRTADALEHRGPQKHPSNRLGLPIQHLRQQIAQPPSARFRRTLRRTRPDRDAPPATTPPTAAPPPTPRSAQPTP